MRPLDNIITAAKSSVKRIVLSEGEDPRIVEASVRIRGDGLAHPILVGRVSRVAELLRAQSADPDHYEILDPKEAPAAAAYAEAYHDLRKHKGVDLEAAHAAVAHPLNFAALMVRQGDADGTVGGAVHTTGDTVRAALQILGRAPNANIVSSFFLMMLCEHHHTKKGGFIFADCGLIIEPSVEELAEIATASAQSFAELIGDEPRVAMLSFSTSGSAQHERVTRVVEAAKVVKARRPELIVDGDLQFDAAFVPAVSSAKAPDSPLEGAANVLVFPNLEAANIGYKIAERIGGAKAIGPILQGLAKPANDLSRGCSVEDIYHLVAVTSVQAQAATL
ncbi:MAG: phosphate acetyltransferase [Pseudomonadota bacterium]